MPLVTVAATVSEDMEATAIALLGQSRGLSIGFGIVDENVSSVRSFRVVDTVELNVRPSVMVVKNRNIEWLRNIPFGRPVFIANGDEVD